MTATRKLWIFLAALLVTSFTVLLWVGGEIHRVMPPIPKAVVTTDGHTLYVVKWCSASHTASYPAWSMTTMRSRARS